MLKKLLKHEFRYYRKFMLITMLVMVVSVIFIRLAIAAMELTPSNVDPSVETLMTLAAIPLTMLCMVLYYTALLSLIVPHVFGAVRYYRNLTQDQGYLSFTLPVKPSQHVFCKTLVPLVWSFILTLVLIVTVVLAFLVGNTNLKEFAEIFQAIGEGIAETGIWGGAWLTLFIVFAVISSICSVVMVNFAISLGQLFRKHKLIGSVLSYIGLNTAISIVTGIFSALALFLIDFEATQAGQALNGYMIGYLSSMSILMLILTVVMYWLSCHIMTKKLNLE